MKQIMTAAVIAVSLVLGIGCSTTGNFKIPPGTKLMVTDREAKPDANGNWTTSPFFWTETAGIKYRLVDSGGKTLRSGKLKSHFRVVSIFWPPVALIYWPMGFLKDTTFDLTKAGDGYLVTDDVMPPGSTSVNPVHEKAPDAAATPAPTKKKSKKAKPATTDTPPPAQ